MAKSKDGVNVVRKEGFSQVCVWPGMLVVESGTTAEEFEQVMLRDMNVRVQYLEEIKTKPDTDDMGDAVPGTGGRNDLFFAVHNDDVMKFAIPRLTMGIRWIEDAIARVNGGNRYYPGRVAKYKL
jgi:hypothetical protein